MPHGTGSLHAQLRGKSVNSENRQVEILSRALIMRDKVVNLLYFVSLSVDELPVLLAAYTKKMLCFRSLMWILTLYS